MSIQEQIKILRKQRSLTQAELASLTELSLITIKSIEQGRREPSNPVIRNIAHVLGCEYIQLLQELENNHDLE